MAAPRHLLARYELSDVSRAGPNFEIRGGYFLGVGRYSVESTVRDDPAILHPTGVPEAVADGRSALSRGVARRATRVASEHRPSVLASGLARTPNNPIPPRPCGLLSLLNAAAFSTFRTVIRRVLTASC